MGEGGKKHFDWDVPYLEEEAESYIGMFCKAFFYPAYVPKKDLISNIVLGFLGR